MPLLEERDSGEVTGPDGAPHHRQIQLALQEQLLHELRSVDLHLQLYLRETEAKGPDSGGEIVDPDIDAAAQPERAGVAVLLEQHFHLIIEGEEGADMVQEQPPLGGDLQALIDPVEKASAVVRLHLSNGDADAGLGEIETLRRPSDALLFGHGLKDAKVPQGQAQPSSHIIKKILRLLYRL